MNLKTILCIAAVLVLAGACRTVKPQMDVVSSNLYIAEKKAINAVLIVPDKSLKFSKLRVQSGSGCLPPNFVVTPYGETFQRAVRDRLTRIFQRVSSGPSLVQADESDVIFEATITDLLFYCEFVGFSSSTDRFYTEVKGSLRILDGAGRELWRSPTDQYRDDSIPYRNSVGSANREYGEAFSKTIAGLAEKWAQELLRTPPRIYGANIKAKPKQQTVTTAPEQPTGAKPTIYIAYPKESLEVAESSVRVLGYVISPNLTKQVKVFANRDSLALDDLWTTSPEEPEGLRGFPLDFTIPLTIGENVIDLKVVDQSGFLVKQTITVNRIELTKSALPKPSAISALPKRLKNIAVAKQGSNVTANNFMAVLGGWVKDTAKTDFNKGNAMFDQGRFARAAYYYKKSIKTDPLGQAWFNLGISEKAQGKDGPATEAFKKACGLKITQACQQAQS